MSLFSGDPIDVYISANRSTADESLVGTITGASYYTTYQLRASLTTLFGEQTAYAGFSASADNFAAFSGPGIQDVSDFQFTSAAVPEPPALALIGIGAIGLLFWARRKNVDFH